MSTASRILASPRLPVLLLLAASAGALATAFFAQYVGGLPPCEMCLWQRWAYAAAIGVLLPGLLLTGRPRARAAVLALGGVAFLVGTAISVFHAGVEQGWWEGFTACTANTGGAASIEDLRAQLLAAPIVRCDEIPWSLLGLSIAGWNAVASAGLALFAFAAAIATARRAAA